MNKDIELAQEKLSIMEVIITSSNFALSEEAENIDFNELDAEVQGFRKSLKVQVVPGTSSNGDDIWLYRFGYIAGVRLVEATPDEDIEHDFDHVLELKDEQTETSIHDDEDLELETLEDEDYEEEDSLIEIIAKFNAVYFSKTELPDSSIQAFSKTHVCYHVWPYWREYVQNICNRMGVPPIAIPMYKVPCD